jgi:hypothetical protein
LFVWILLRVSWVAVLFLVSWLIQYYNLVSSFIDALFVLAVGMILGAIYIETGRLFADYLQRKPHPPEA